MITEPQLRQIIEDFVAELEELLAGLPKEAVKQETREEGLLSKRLLIELASHEGAVLESYKDSVGVWTWGVGVTNNSGHSVDRYKDNPQSIEKVLEVYEWLVREKYLPSVLEVFEGYDLSEEQLAAALSFHYNTGAIKRASWVKSFKQGKISQAKRQFMNWKKPKEIIGRRAKERDLFFDGKWSNKGTIPVYTRVNKRSYSPVWSSRKNIKAY